VLSVFEDDARRRHSISPSIIRLQAQAEHVKNASTVKRMHVRIGSDLNLLIKDLGGFFKMTLDRPRDVSAPAYAG
jgi:hypothetical protein